MWAAFDDSWRNPRRRVFHEEKQELEPFVKDEIAFKITSCKIKPIEEILRSNLKEVVEFLVKCFEDATEMELVDHVWRSIKNDSKFWEIKSVLAELALTLEDHRSNLKITKLSPEMEKRFEEIVRRKAASMPAEKEEPEKPAKRFIRCDPVDPRPVPSDYTPPKSIFSDTRSVKKVIPASTSQSNDIQRSTSQNSRATNNMARIPAGYSAPLTRNEKASSTREHQQPSARTALSFPSELRTNDNSSVRRKSPPPPPQPTAADEDGDDDGLEEETRSVQPRDTSYYSKRYDLPNESQSTPSQNLAESNNDEHLLDSDEEDIPSNDIGRDQPTIPTAQIPLSSSISKAAPAATPQPARRSMFDDISDDEDVSPEPKRRKTTIRFDEKATADNEGQPKKSITLASAVQPHETMDVENKVNMEGPNPTKCKIAFPNQRGPCFRPAYNVLEKWTSLSQYEGIVKDTISYFRNSQHVYNIGEKAPEHLVILDSMLSGIPFEQTYKLLHFLDCAYPNNPFQIIDFLKDAIAAENNDYVMKNVFICLGLDFITYDPDVKRARQNALKFFQQFLNIIIAAFNPKGPPRYRRATDKAYTEAFLDITPPKLIFITIPQVVSSDPYVITLNEEISKINDDIRKFVKKCEEDAGRKRVIMKVYDWEKACEKYKQCNETDLRKRNDILMKHLSNEYAVLMYPEGQAPY